MRESTQKAILTAKKFLAKREPDMAAFVLRDLKDTQEKGLNDMAWAMCQSGYVHENDVKFLIDQLEEV